MGKHDTLRTTPALVVLVAQLCRWSILGNQGSGGQSRLQIRRRRVKELQSGEMNRIPRDPCWPSNRSRSGMWKRTASSSTTGLLPAPRVLATALHVCPAVPHVSVVPQMPVIALHASALVSYMPVPPTICLCSSCALHPQIPVLHYLPLLLCPRCLYCTSRLSGPPRLYRCALHACTALHAHTAVPYMPVLP